MAYPRPARPCGQRQGERHQATADRRGGAKGDFLGIKNASCGDFLAACRVLGQLLGIIPANAGRFGDPAKALDGSHELEIEPLHSVRLEVLGAEVAS